MAHPVTHFEIIGKDNRKLLAGPVELAMFADPEGNVIGLAKGM